MDFSSIVSLIVCIASIVAMWRIFQKAGYAGWKSIIPIYSSFILWKIAGRDFKRFILITIGALLLITILSAIAQSATGLAGIIGIVVLIVYIALLIFEIVEIWGVCSGLATGFGHEKGFAAGLFFLSIIFFMILGFNDDKYVGENRGTDVAE